MVLLGWDSLNKIPDPRSNNQNGGLLDPMYRTPPFYGNWPNDTIGMGIKKKRNAHKKGDGLLLGKNSPFKKVPLLNILL